MAHALTNQIQGLYFNKTNPIEVANSLRGIEYPVNKKGLLKCARDNEARAEIIKVIKNLPEKEYDDPISISQELGNIEHYTRV